MRTVGISGYQSSAASLGVLPTHQRWWLDIRPSERFTPLIDLNLARRVSYRERVVPYLNRRGVDDSVMVEQLVRIDLGHIAHALTVLFDTNHASVLQSMLPSSVSSLVSGREPVIDHVARELFGPLDFYLEILSEMAPRLGLEHLIHSPEEDVTGHGDAVYQSIEVLAALRRFDPDLDGVTIAEALFRDTDRPSHRGCLELIQPADRAGLHPQCHRHTIERMTNLLTESGGTGLPLQPPICHLGVKAPDDTIVVQIHDAARHDTSGMVLPPVEPVPDTAGPGTSTRLSIRATPDAPVYNRIIEVAHNSR